MSFGDLLDSACWLFDLLILLYLFVVYDFCGVAVAVLWVVLICMLTVGLCIWFLLFIIGMVLFIVWFACQCGVEVFCLPTV